MGHLLHVSLAQANCLWNRKECKKNHAQKESKMCMYHIHHLVHALFKSDWFEDYLLFHGMF